MTRREIIAALYRGVDPLDGFPAREYQPDLQGWGGLHPIFREVIELYQPRLVVEVGSWKGQSAVTIASALKMLGLGSQLICIDTWLGGEEHFGRGELPQKFGYPQLYYQFAANIILQGLDDTVIPIPQTSHIAAEILRSKNIVPDVIYIDASHEYGDVVEDLARYGGILSPEGCIIGDDYHYTWPGVARAAREYAQQQGLPLHIYETKFFLTRNTDKVPKNCVAAVEQHNYFELDGSGKYVMR